jgi:hypothetical protein
VEIRIKNNDSSNHTWGGKEFTPGEIYNIQVSDYSQFLTSVSLFADVGSGKALVGSLDTFFTDPIEGWEYLEHEADEEVTTTGEPIVTWTQMKAFYTAMASISRMFYIDLGDYYFLWLSVSDQKLFVPNLVKESTDGGDFEDNYKAICNVPEAFLTRITTCQMGKALHLRYISFTTADQDNYDNTDYNEVDYGDVTYTMKKWVDDALVTTTVNSECEETWIDWEPAYSFEIMGGVLCIPGTLAGDNDNAWEVHILGAPDVPAAYGGCVQFVANPRLKWSKSSQIVVDCALNPKVVQYSAVYHTGKIRTIIKHPAGAQTEFQLNFKIFGG